MGLNSEWNTFNDVFDDDDSNSDFEWVEEYEDYEYTDWCDLYSTDLLNTWYCLLENAQLYHKINTKLTFSDFCMFMYKTIPEEVIFEDVDDLKNLWMSIGSPKTFYEFYIFYR
jgi:hypothetical protein